MQKIKTKEIIKRHIPENGVRIYRGLRDWLITQGGRVNWQLQRLTMPLKIFLKKYFPYLIHIETSLSENKRYSRYTEICEMAVKDSSIFDTFKSNPDYKRILEHLTEEDGQAYLDIIKKEGKDILQYLKRFQENDMYGSPVTFVYDIGSFSPTTLRYIKVLVDLKNLFGDLNNLDIIEIGGGYGGQCKIASDFFNYNSYNIIDLAAVLPLVQKYLTKLNVKNVYYIPPAMLTNNKIYDLVISNYAFSECINYVQDEYIEKVLNRAKRGYITYNYDKDKDVNHPSVPYNKNQIVQILSKNHSICILEENPRTGPMNFIIVWDDTRR